MSGVVRVDRMAPDGVEGSPAAVQVMRVMAREPIGRVVPAPASQLALRSRPCTGKAK